MYDGDCTFNNCKTELQSGELIREYFDIREGRKVIKTVNISGSFGLT